MRHLLLFESFIDSLDEMIYSDHWKERTAYPREENSHLSRILPYSSNFNRYGFKIDSFIDDNRNSFPLRESLQKLDISEEQANNYITRALRNLTRSSKLEKWDPTNLPYLMLRLGRIVFYKDEDTKLYPLIKGGDGKGGFYDSGDCVWGLAGYNKNNIVEGITVKYYPDTEEGETMMKMTSEYSTKLKSADFYRNSKIEYPYGKNFVITVDLTDDKVPSIEGKMRDQVEGREWKLGGGPKIDLERFKDPDYLTPEFRRTQIYKGLILTIHDKETGKDRTYEVDSDPLNSDEIYNSYLADKENGTRSLKSMPIRFRAYSMDSYIKYDRLTNAKYPVYQRKSSISTQVSIKPGDLIYIRKSMKKSSSLEIDPNQLYEFRFITSEPKILQRGSAQIALDLPLEKSE